jgi:transcription termination factor NusB
MQDIDLIHSAGVSVSSFENKTFEEMISFVCKLPCITSAERKAGEAAAKFRSDRFFTVKFVRSEERRYLSNYWKQHFDELRKNETRSMLTGVLENHSDISRFLRAHLVDWLFHVCNALKKDD